MKQKDKAITSQKNKKPLVSVIMPSYNAANYLVSAIDSILQQSFTDFELIVINDGSTDNSEQVLQAYQKKNKDKRLKIISYYPNKGESAAANIGYQQAKGKYIARMDADDLAHPDRLSKQVAFIEKNPAYIVVGTQAHIINEDNQIIGEKVFPTTNQEIYQEYGNLHPILHPSMMVRRSLLPWKDKLWANEGEPNDDYYTLFHFLKMGKFANLPEKLMYYRMHADNKSLQNIKHKFINSLKIRAYAFKQLGYRFTVITYFKLLTQALFVLLMPEWVTIGIFCYVKGIKPFDLAFPQLAKLKYQFLSWLKSLNIHPAHGNYRLSKS